MKGKPKETLIKALELFEEKSGTNSDKTAIDLGCGHGPDTLELLKRGWTVTAIDSQKDGLEIIKGMISPEWSERLQLRQSEFEGLKLQKALLVNASLCLFFSRPDYFNDIWNEIVDSINIGGRFSGNLCGLHDSWAVYENMTFHSQADIDRMFEKFDIEYFNETEQDVLLADRYPKHWHLYDIVARKK